MFTVLDLVLCLLCSGLSSVFTVLDLVLCLLVLDFVLCLLCSGLSSVFTVLDLVLCLLCSGHSSSRIILSHVYFLIRVFSGKY